MNKDSSPVLLEQYLIRAVMSLCMAAAVTDMDDVREDLRDLVAILIRLAMSGSQDNILKDWCYRTLTTLDSLPYDSDLNYLSTARLSVLRLRSVLSVSQDEVAPSSDVKPPKVKKVSIAPAMGPNQKKIIDYVKENPDIRTRELITHFHPTLSDRTIKRCLKELANNGVLLRSKKDGAVLYRLSSGESMLDPGGAS